MRTRTRLSLLVIAALVASALGSLAAVATTAGTAEACSIAGPYGEVRPSADLKQGQRVEIAGWGFYDLQLHEPQPQRVAPPDDDNGDVPELCDFDLSPMANLDVYWRGTTSAWLGMVSGPDFTTTVVVPPDVLPGPATIIVGPVELAVFVGQPIEIPPPCPLTLQPDGTAHHVCPEPWPCPLPAGSGYTASGGTQPAPDADHAPGFLPPCPEPCVDAAHTIDDGTVYDYRWDCPDPCSPIHADPGASPQDRAVWCPPPDPCPLPALWTNDDPTQSEGLPWCPPVPCHLLGSDALVCPEAETSAPGPALVPSAEISEADPAPSPASAAPASAAPTSVAGTTGAAETGVAETGAAETGAAETGAAETGAVETTSTESPVPAVVAAPPAPAPPTPQEPARTDTSRGVSDLVAGLSQRMSRITGVIVASILG